MVEPIWATELLLKVCEDEGRSKKPKINWGYSTSSWRMGSSGNYSRYTNTIRVVTKKSIPYSVEQKQVFLHEICHWLTKPRRVKRVYFYGERRQKRAAHGKRFYSKLHELLVRYDCLTTEYQEREARYMKRSVNYL